MILLISFITFVFLYAAFFASSSQGGASNSLVGYALYQEQFLLQHLIIFTVGCIILTGIFFRFNFDRQFSVRRIFFFSSLQTVVTVVISFFVSYCLLFVIAWIQLNSASFMINRNPGAVGIVTDSTTIKNALQNTTHPPQIIASDQEQKNVLVSIVRATSGVNNYYGSTALASIPGFLVVPLRDVPSGMLLIDNTLIITKITAKDMEVISPFIGHSFLQTYFPSRRMLSYPKVTFMDKKEYQGFRVEDAKKKIVKIDIQLQTIDEYISSYSATLEGDKSTRSIKAKKQLIAEYESYKEFYTYQKDRLEDAAQSIPHELGVFRDPDTITIIFNTNNPHAVADYLATLVHEYLHYASFVSKDKQFTSSFFEEGLTEYLARGAINRNLRMTTNLGYPLQVKIIEQMTNMITESEFAELYFNKDEEGLERALDRVYGDGFYENNLVLFESLQYSSDPEEMVAIANAIMEKIGGEEALTEKDLKSSYSSL